MFESIFADRAPALPFAWCGFARYRFPQYGLPRYSDAVFLCAFPESVRLPAELIGTEAPQLGRLEPALLARGFVFTSRAEEAFYLSNNLPEQLRAIFKGINPRRLDEDALEHACTQAARLVTESYMLEDFISQAYLALHNTNLENTVLHVRRERSSVREGGDGRRGAILALKRLWARDWAFEAVLNRLDATGSVGLEERPALVFTGSGGNPDANLSSLASRSLGVTVRAVADGGKIVGLE